MKLESNYQISTFVSSNFASNLYLVSTKDEQIIIDPSVSFYEIYKDGKANLQAIFITHAHFDHLVEISSYLENTNAKVYLHKNALEKLSDGRKNCSVFLGKQLTFSIPEERLVLVDSKSKFSFLGQYISFIETPGHSTCSICICFDKVLFTGDTLFKNNIGRTDLYSSNFEELQESLSKIMEFEDDYLVYPGHGRSTSIKIERINNPYWKGR